MIRTLSRGTTPSPDPTRSSWRAGAANHLGFALQLALLRHPGTGLVRMDEPVDALVTWLAARMDIPAATFTRVCQPAADDDGPRAHPRRGACGCVRRVPPICPS